LTEKGEGGIFFKVVLKLFSREKMMDLSRKISLAGFVLAFIAGAIAVIIYNNNPSTTDFPIFLVLSSMTAGIGGTISVGFLMLSFETSDKTTGSE